MKEKIIEDFNGKGDMVEIPCSRKYTKNQPIHVCISTGLVRVKNLRSSKEIAEEWSNEIYGAQFNDKTYTARIPAVKARQTYVADYIDTEIGLGNKNICDVGAGEGQFFEIISSYGLKTNLFGIEPSKKNCYQLKKNNYYFFKGTIEDFSKSSQFEKNKFDIVTLMWTLTNSQSCLNMVKIVYDMLKVGGSIVVAEGSRILVPFKKPLNMYFSEKPADLNPYFFSRNSIINLLKVSNFEIASINRYIDSDVLCITAKKPNNILKQNYQVDNHVDILDFFKRWDKETKYY